jgi:ABC-type transport system substrate-binding protein
MTGKRILFLFVVVLLLALAACGGQVQQAVEEAAPTVEAAVQEAAPTVEAAVEEVAPTVEAAVEEAAPTVEAAVEDMADDGAAEEDMAEEEMADESMAEGEMGEAKYGGTLNVAFQNEWAGLDPHVVSSYSSYQILFNVVERLTQYDDDLNLQPMLAESWEQSEDGLTWTFKLREGVMFHNA